MTSVLGPSLLYRIFIRIYDTELSTSGGPNYLHTVLHAAPDLPEGTNSNVYTPIYIFHLVPTLDQNGTLRLHFQRTESQNMRLRLCRSRLLPIPNATILASEMRYFSIVLSETPWHLDPQYENNNARRWVRNAMLRMEWFGYLEEGVAAETYIRLVAILERRITRRRPQLRPDSWLWSFSVPVMPFQDVNPAIEQ